MERLNRSIATITLAAVVAIILGTLLRNPLQRIFANPLAWANSKRVAVSTSFRSITQISDLRQDREELQKEVTTLRQQLSEQSELQRENEALRKELGATGTNRSLQKLMAQVISQTGSIIDRGFLISAGKNQGVLSGQPVISGGYLVGRVSNVHNDTAEVRSVTSKQSIIQVWVSASATKGLLRGDGNTVSFDNVEQGQKVDEGALLETSGLGGSLPRGILIGTVHTKTSSDTDLTQQFRANLGTNPSDATTVFVVTSAGS